MEAIAPYLTYAAALGIAAAIPGPGIAALVGQSLGGSLRGALLFLAGLAIGDIVFLTVAVAGLAALAQTFAAAFAVLKVAGALYLLYLGWVFWTARGGIGAPDARPRRSGLRSVMAGLAVTLGNPKTVVFYLAILPGVMDLDAVGPGMWATLALLTVVVLFAVLTPYALLSSRARRMMASPRALRRLNRAAGGIIGAAGAALIGQAASAALRRA
ncbi:LysE family translocator [Poseidonocella sp. HB161398]|uniref:LysE family translocator n=1 Tax=Poseidonocella sp. HB161398 TaxID=2320855 RepID=UPI0011082309|nr:LysE family translocator [Poseidonocella sp. HB161398]